MSDISLPITSITAIINGCVLLILTWHVITLRRKDGVVLGDNDDRVMAKAIRGHGNAAEQIPMALVVLALAELQSAPSALLIVLAAVFTTGRVMHAIYFAKHGTPWRLRFYGMLATVATQVGLLIALLITLIS